jgi:hypothetical protein
MRRLFLPAAVAACWLTFAVPAALNAQAVKCKDGTTAASSGRGACSHHGGVSSVVLTVSCRDGSTATPGRGACSHHGGTGTPASVRTRSSSSTRVRASQPTVRRTSGPATSSEGRVACRDGTTSTSGRGACSHHGGVGPASGEASAGSHTRAEAPPTRTAGEIPAPAPPAPGAPAGASARCNDGTYSNTQHRSGACSHHGGVKEWYKDLPVRWY